MRHTVSFSFSLENLDSSLQSTNRVAVDLGMRLKNGVPSHSQRLGIVSLADELGAREMMVQVAECPAP